MSTSFKDPIKDLAFAYAEALRNKTESGYMKTYHRHSPEYVKSLISHLAPAILDAIQQNEKFQEVLADTLKSSIDAVIKERGVSMDDELLFNFSFELYNSLILKTASDEGSFENDPQDLDFT